MSTSTKFVSLLVGALVGLPGAGHAGETRTGPGGWYAADASRLPRIAIEGAVTERCPELEPALAIAKYVLLNGSFWKDAKAPSGIDLAAARVGVAGLLDDPKLNIKWNKTQVALADLSEKGRSAAAETLDDHNVQLNEVACRKRLPGGAIVQRSAAEIASTLVHELLHVWGKRNGVGTADGLLGVGVAYDFEALLPAEPFSPEALAEVGAMGIAGKWQSEWGPVTLVVEGGATISGWWDQAADKVGRITGGTYVTRTRTLTIHYYEDWAKLSGTAILTLKPGGRVLDGTWTQPNGAGTWTMKR